MKNNKKYVGSSPMKFPDPVTASLAISAGVGLINTLGGLKRKKAARRRAAAAELEAAPYLEAYKTEEYLNPYANMENVYEDMRTDTQAQEFQREQLAQQQADILQGLRGAAGGAGVAALAQSMARQGAIQAQAISADISQQEQAIQERQLAEQSRIQQLQMQGEEMVRERERERLANLYAISAGKAGIAFGEEAQATQDIMAGLGDIGSAVVTGIDAGAFSPKSSLTLNDEVMGLGIDTSGLGQLKLK